METLIHLPDGTDIHTNTSFEDPLPTQEEYKIWDEEEKRIALVQNQHKISNDEKEHQQQIEEAQNRLLLFQSIESGLAYVFQII